MIFTPTLIKALSFAAKAHGDQRRKYTNEPYIVHPIDVAGLVFDYGGTEAMQAAALLHDVVEDTDVSQDLVDKKFGNEIGELVYWLTDVSKPSDGNRKARKEIDRIHISVASAEAQTVKVCDLLSNTKTITQYDPNFSMVYMKEKAAVLAVLTKADNRLVSRARQRIDEFYFAQRVEA